MDQRRREAGKWMDWKEAKILDAYEDKIVR